MANGRQKTDYKKKKMAKEEFVEWPDDLFNQSVYRKSMVNLIA